VNLTDKQKELLRQFEHSIREGGARHSPRESSWLDKLTSLFT
jgi:molecular chaperone DnaJ